MKYNSILNEFNGDEELADKKLIERIENLNKSRFGKASKRSLKIFNQLIDICDNNSIDYKIGIEGNCEHSIFDNINKKLYFYDFTIPKINLIFEFQGRLFHIKSKVDNLGFNKIGINLNKKFETDEIKKELAEKNGFEVIYLWEEDGFEYNMKKSIDILNKKLSKNLSKFN